MTTERKRLSAKLRDGFEAHLEPMLQLYTANSGELGTFISADGVRQAEKDAVALGEQQAAAQAEAARAGGQRTR